MDISDNTFENNRGLESCISINTNANNDLNSSYTRIQNNKFERNEGNVISIIENIYISHIHLEKNVITQNSGQALVIRHGNVTDQLSTYAQNTAEVGAGVTMMKDSIYTGTEITFESNEANTQGGAIFATTQSIFICSLCTFTKNKAQKGGAVLVESSSRTEITSSTFDGNIATKIGSAYYISNSETNPMSSIKTSTFTQNQV